MHQLPPLPYSFDALEPHIDARTMEIHHDKHHAAYVTNLNKALESQPDWQSSTVADLLHHLQDLPEAIRTAVRNHGGGHANHTLFWSTLGPASGSEPAGTLKRAIDSTFGNFAAFKERMTAAAMGQFGSGWSWLAWDAGKLEVFARPNQDSPLMENKVPILGVDVWEHAYYLRYQNRRADYLQAWWNVVDWKAAGERYREAAGG